MTILKVSLALTLLLLAGPARVRAQAPVPARFEDGLDLKEVLADLGAKAAASQDAIPAAPVAPPSVRSRPLPLTVDLGRGLSLRCDDTGNGYYFVHYAWDRLGRSERLSQYGRGAGDTGYSSSQATVALTREDCALSLTEVRGAALCLMLEGKWRQYGLRYVDRWRTVVAVQMHDVHSDTHAECSSSYSATPELEEPPPAPTGTCYCRCRAGLFNLCPEPTRSSPDFFITAYSASECAANNGRSWAGYPCTVLGIATREAWDRDACRLNTCRWTPR